MRLKTIVISIVITLFVQSLVAQQDQYQMQMIEALSGFYDVSNDVFEAKVHLNLVSDSVSSDSYSEEFNEINSFIKQMKNDLGLTESSLEMALASADMIYCLNGQKNSDELLIEIDLLQNHNKELLKLIKLVKKETDIDQYKISIEKIDKLLADVIEICEKAAKKTLKAQEVCN